MDLEECINKRRSIRNFQSKAVEKEKILKLIESAQMAPFWKNSQVSRFFVISSEKVRKEIANCLASFNQENTKNAPVIIVSTVVKNISGFEKDGSYSTHLKDGFQYFDNGLQVQNLCLEAYNLGLGTLIMGIYDEEKIRSLLNIPKDQEIVAVIGVGYPNIEPKMPKRLEVDEVVKFF